MGSNRVLPFLRYSYRAFLYIQYINKQMHSVKYYKIQNIKYVNVSTHLIGFILSFSTRFDLNNIYIYIYIYIYIQGVTGGTDQTSGGCSLC
jgi:hypothetical protein